MKAPRQKTRFVPRVVYRTAFAGVVPLCVAGAACGGSSTGGGGGTPPSVACAGFGCGAVGVQAFADASDSPVFSVACIGFNGGPCGTLPPGDASGDGDGAQQHDGSTDGSTRDSPVLAVACLGFCGVADAAFIDGGGRG